MEYVSSTANEKVKAARKLHQKKYRDDCSLFIAEGLNILSDMPLDVRVKRFFVTEKVFSQTEALLKRFDAEIVGVTDAVMESLSETVTPSGLLAVIEIPEGKADGGNALVLDGVADCGNLGTIIRTAAGANFKDIYLINCADAYAPKTVRASMGGVFRVNLILSSYVELINQLNGYEKITMDMSGANVFLHKPTGKTALFLGNEAHGLSETARNLADVTLAIPMDNGQESLNVAVASGIAMYVLNNNRNNL